MVFAVFFVQLRNATTMFAAAATARMDPSGSVQVRPEPSRP
jgi:hypothetical protein